MGQRKKRWRPWDLNRLAAEIAADIRGSDKTLPRLILKLPRARRQPRPQPRPADRA